LQRTIELFFQFRALGIGEQVKMDDYVYHKSQLEVVVVVVVVVVVFSCRQLTRPC
jgi:hypothetical protein